jgi:hypothetical protein
MPSSELDFFLSALNPDQSELDQMRYALANRAPPKPANYEQTREIPTPENIVYGNYLAEQEALRRQSQVKATSPQGQFMERVVAPYVEPALSILSSMGSMPLAAGESLAKTGTTKALELANIITPAQRAELLAKTPSIEQQIAARTFEPRSAGGKENLQALMQLAEESKLPHMWPVAGGRAPVRSMLTPDDVRAMGGQAAKLKQEVRDIPIDFPNAKQGMVRLDQFGEPTVGAKLGVVANRAESAGQALDLPGITDRPPVGAIRMPGGQLMVPKSVGDISPEAVSLPVGKITDVLTEASPVGEVFAKASLGNAGVLHNTYQKLYLGPRENMTQDQASAFNFDMQTSLTAFEENQVKQLFPDAALDEAYEAFNTLYSLDKRLEMRYNWLDAFTKSPEAQDIAQRFGVQLPSLQEFNDRLTAANQWLTGPFTQYVQKFVGTEKDPLLQLAEQGMTFRPAAELIEAIDDYTSNYSKVIDEVKKARQQFNKDPEGSYKQRIAEKETELETLQDDYRTLNAERRALGEKFLAENPNRDPADDPTYAATTNPLKTKEKEITRASFELDNLKLADRFELISDAIMAPRISQNVKNELSYAQKKFFPGIEKIPDIETVYDIRKSPLRISGLEEAGSKFTRDIMQGVIPVDQIKNTPLARFIRDIAETRIKEERDAKLAEIKYINDLQNKLLDDIGTLPTVSKFGNITALTIDSSYPKSEIARLLSADTEILDHCVASGGPGGKRKHFLTGKSRNHEPVANPITGVIQSKFDESQLPRYIRDVERGSSQIVSIRDNTTGYPVGTIEMFAVQNPEPPTPEVMAILAKYLSPENVEKFMTKVDVGGVRNGLAWLENATDSPNFSALKNEIEQLPTGQVFNIGSAYGYQNGAIDANYAKSIAEYLNANSNKIAYSSDPLTDAGIYDAVREGVAELASRFSISPMMMNDVLQGKPRFVTRSEIKQGIKDLKTRQADEADVNDPVIQGMLTALNALNSESTNLRRGASVAQDLRLRPELYNLENAPQNVINDIANTMSLYESFFAGDLIKEFSRELGRRKVMQAGGEPVDVAANLVLNYFNTMEPGDMRINANRLRDQITRRPTMFDLENTPPEVRQELAQRIANMQPFDPFKELTINDLQNLLSGKPLEQLPAVAQAPERPLIANAIFAIMEDNFNPDNPLEMLYEPRDRIVATTYSTILDRVTGDDNVTSPGDAVEKLREYANRVLTEEFARLEPPQRNLAARYINSHAQIIENALGPQQAAQALMADPEQLPVPAERPEFIRTAVEAYDRYFDANQGFNTPETFQTLVGLTDMANNTPEALPGVQPQGLGARGITELRNSLATTLVARTMEMDPLQYRNILATAITDKAARTGDYTQSVPMLRLTLFDDHRALYDGLIAGMGRTNTLQEARNAFSQLLDSIDQLEIFLDNYPSLMQKIEELRNEGMDTIDAKIEVLSPIHNVIDTQLRAIDQLIQEENPPADIFARGGFVQNPTLAQMRAEMMLRNHNA